VGSTINNLGLEFHLPPVPTGSLKHKKNLALDSKLALSSYITVATLASHPGYCWVNNFYHASD
jgi:hypothetical protein